MEHIAAENIAAVENGETYTIQTLYPVPHSKTNATSVWWVEWTILTEIGIYDNSKQIQWMMVDGA